MELEPNHGHHASGTHASLPLDPVCGMRVDPAKAAGNATHDGRTYYFCSLSCLRKFQADPQRYLHGDSDAQPTLLHSTLAPACEQGRVTDSAPPSGVTYTCPMHPVGAIAS